jgi:hypothetical protein
VTRSAIEAEVERLAWSTVSRKAADFDTFQMRQKFNSPPEAYHHNRQVFNNTGNNNNGLSSGINIILSVSPLPPQEIQEALLLPFTSPQKFPDLKIPDFYLSQIESALALFRLLQQSSNYKKKKFSGVDFRIFTPPRTTLTKQTQERLQTLMCVYLMPKNHPLQDLIFKTKQQGIAITDVANRFDKTNPSWVHLQEFLDLAKSKVITTLQFRDGKAGPEFEQLEKDIFSTDQQGQRKLMIIIHDESHWGIKKNQQVDILFNGAPHKNGQQPNKSNPLCEPNVFILHVSATGWNFDVKGINHKVVSWKTAPPGYTSQESYATGKNKQEYLRVDNHFGRLLESLTSKFPESVAKKYFPTVALLIDYALECIRIQKQASAHKSVVDTPPLPYYFPDSAEPSEHTTWLFDHFCNYENQGYSKNPTVLIRIQKGGLIDFFITWLKMIRSLLPLNHGMRKFKIASPSSSLSELKIVDSFENSEINQHPTIVVVIEKAKMGDTLPNLSAFDLRPRYTTDTSSYSSFVQDFGRVCGFRPTPPTAILNQQGCYILSGVTYNVDRFLLPLEDIIRETPQVANFSRQGDNVLLPSSESMWYRVLFEANETVLRHVAENRFLLLARPQSGKTGAFLKFLELVFEDQYSTLPFSIVNGKYPLLGSEV